MVAIKLETFGGMNPAVDDYLLPNSGAAYCENTWLYEGNLSGFKTPHQVRTLTNSSTKRVYRIPLDPYEKTDLMNSVWMEFTDPFMDVVRAPVIDDQYSRYYWFGASSSGGATTPSYNTLDRLTLGNASYKLGVPEPVIAPGVAAPTLAADTDPPVPASMTVNGAIIVITFTEARRMDALATPPANAFAVKCGTDTKMIVSAVNVDELNCKVTLTLTTSVKPNSDVTVVYTPPADDIALKDNSGNLVAAFTQTLAAADNETLDLLAPVFDHADTSDNGKYIWVTFADDSPLDMTKVPPNEAWFVFVNGAAQTVTETVKLTQGHEKMSYKLTVGASLTSNDKVTLSYVRPGDAYAIADTAGNKVSTFTNATVRNNTQEVKTTNPPVVSTVTLLGRTVAIVFEKELDGSQVPAAGRFTFSDIYTSGQHVVAVSVDAAGKTIYLQLSNDTYYYGSYALSYNASNSGTLSNVFITDKGGSVAAAFTNKQVTNNNPTPAYDPNGQ